MAELKKDAAAEEEEIIIDETEEEAYSKKLKGEIMRERKRWGFFGIPWTFTENEILLYRVTDITLKRTFWQKIFGLGTLIVYAHDKTNPTLEIKNIKHIREYKDALSEAVEKDRIRMKMRQSEIVDGAYDFHDHDIDF